MRIAYYRVSTGDQSVEAQRHAMGGGFDREFADEGVSGGVLAADRPQFSKLLEQVRAGDTVHVYAVDRLGRDALDVQATVRRLMQAQVIVHVHGLGPISGDVGELILAVLAQVADMERRRISERTEAGRQAARKALEATGRTHRGKESLGRPKASDEAAVAEWRVANQRSIQETARHFGISPATVKRYCAVSGGGASTVVPSKGAQMALRGAEADPVALDDREHSPDPLNLSEAELATRSEGWR